jgi:hypothetical protein
MTQVVLLQYLGLKDEDWKFDTIPEIMDGKNIADFVDPEIERMLEEVRKCSCLLVLEVRKCTCLLLDFVDPEIERMLEEARNCTCSLVQEYEY